MNAKHKKSGALLNDVFRNSPVPISNPFKGEYAAKFCGCCCGWYMIMVAFLLLLVSDELFLCWTLCANDHCLNNVMIVKLL